MARYPHYLQPTNGDKQPTQIAVFATLSRLEPLIDAEHTQRELLRCGHISSFRRHRNNCDRFNSDPFTLSVEFWGRLFAIARKNTCTWVFSLDLLRQLTLLNTWEMLERGELILDDWDNARNGLQPSGQRKEWHGYAILEDPPTVLVVRQRCDRGLLKFVDLKNYGITSWTQLTQSVWYPDIAENEPWEDAGVAALICEQRCSVLTEHILRFIALLQSQNMGGLQATVGSQAFYSFKHRWLQSPIEVHCNEKALELERAAYYGGRNECYYLGRVDPPTELAFPRGAPDETWPKERPVSPVYHLDVNSLYPSVCLDAQLPVRLIGYSESLSVGDLCDLTSGYCVIADVELDTPVPAYPLRAKPDVIYPVGKFRTCLADAELRLALNCKHVTRCHSVAWYYTERVLHEYMHDLFAIRRDAHSNADSATAEIVKRLLNALPGKFAQRSKRWVDCSTVKAVRPFCTWLEADNSNPVCHPDCERSIGHHPDCRNSLRNEPVRYRSIAWHVQRLEDQGEHPESIPSIAACITSLARVQLWTLMAICQPDDLYYCDTDSIWCGVRSYHLLREYGAVDPSQIGKLKLVARHNHVEFKGLKHYIADGVLTYAGLPPGTAIDRDNRYLTWHPEGMSEAVWHNKAPSAVQIPAWIRPSEAYRHGVVDSSGWVKPIRTGV